MLSVNTRYPAMLQLVSLLWCATVAVPAMADPASDSPSTPQPTDSVVRRSIVHYTVPALKMLRDDGTHVSLDQELNDGRPVILNFIYTTCTTICPLSSQVFSVLQQRLGGDRDSVHLVSISIDPEQDTISRLSDYARQFHAGKEWNHYTGSAASSRQAQVAFGVYRGDKMYHSPVTLLRAAPGDHWVRLDGYATADDLYTEVRGLRDKQNLQAQR